MAKQMIRKCEACKGTGKSRLFKYECARCGGSGLLRDCDCMGCIEYGCEGHGHCYVAKSEEAAND